MLHDGSFIMLYHVSSSLQGSHCLSLAVDILERPWMQKSWLMLIVDWFLHSCWTPQELCAASTIARSTAFTTWAMRSHCSLYRLLNGVRNHRSTARRGPSDFKRHVFGAVSHSGPSSQVKPRSRKWQDWRYYETLCGLFAYLLYNEHTWTASLVARFRCDEGY